MGESLCYKTNDGRLAHKKEGESKGLLVYKSKIATIYVYWGPNDKDLDLCAYWLGYPEGKVGWDWTRRVSHEEYRLTWYGDNTGYGGNEKLLPAIVPWGASVNHVLRVHFNWYITHGSGTCSVRITSSDGHSIIEKTGITCGQRHGQKADVQDPYIDVTFDSKGNVVSVVQ